MMKKVLALILAVFMLTTLLVACDGDKAGDSSSAGDSDNNNDQQVPASDVDLEAVMNEINSRFDISEDTVQGLRVLKDTDELDRYYMISDGEINQFAAERSSSSTDFTEIVIVEAVDSDTVDSIVARLNSRLDAQRSTARSYNPESVELLDNCSVQTKGNFVYLVINDNQDEIVKIIEGAVE